MPSYYFNILSYFRMNPEWDIVLQYICFAE
jgi:hypothetical protein